MEKNIYVCIKMERKRVWEGFCALLKRKTSEVNICLSNCCGDCQLQRIGFWKRRGLVDEGGQRVLGHVGVVAGIGDGQRAMGKCCWTGWATDTTVVDTGDRPCQDKRRHNDCHSAPWTNTRHLHLRLQRLQGNNIPKRKKGKKRKTNGNKFPSPKLRYMFSPGRLAVGMGAALWNSFNYPIYRLFFNQITAFHIQCV